MISSHPPRLHSMIQEPHENTPAQPKTHLYILPSYQSCQHRCRTLLQRPITTELRPTISLSCPSSMRFSLAEDQGAHCRHGCRLHMNSEEAASQHHSSARQSSPGWHHHTRRSDCSWAARRGSGCAGHVEAAGCCSWGCTGLVRGQLERDLPTQSRRRVVRHGDVGGER